MPNIEKNISKWNSEYDWTQLGDEWSWEWGNPQFQWQITILPRILNNIPAKKILEIAPGYGRWTNFLIPLCDEITIVDLSENCIEHCKKRFKNIENVKYYVNNGKTLDFVADNSIDFVFSFDSLVHAEIDVIDAYIGELSRILSKNGTAFIHHSNAGMYKNSLSFADKLEKIRTKIKIKFPFEYITWHWRARSVTAKKIAELCDKYGLECVTQELVNWGNSSTYLIDCFSTIKKKERNVFKSPTVNHNFMEEAKLSKKLFSTYYNVI